MATVACSVSCDQMVNGTIRYGAKPTGDGEGPCDGATSRFHHFARPMTEGDRRSCSRRRKPSSPSSGGPPGVWTLAFVLTYALVARQRDSFAGLSGLAAVVGFAAAAAFACVTAHIAVSGLAFLSGTRPPPIIPIMGELAMTVLFYAPTTLVIGWLHHKLVGASRGDV